MKIAFIVFNVGIWTSSALKSHWVQNLLSSNQGRYQIIESHPKIDSKVSLSSTTESSIGVSKLRRH